MIDRFRRVETYTLVLAQKNDPLEWRTITSIFYRVTSCGQSGILVYVCVCFLWKKRESFDTLCEVVKFPCQRQPIAFPSIYMCICARDALGRKITSIFPRYMWCLCVSSHPAAAIARDTHSISRSLLYIDIHTLCVLTCLEDFNGEKVRWFFYNIPWCSSSIYINSDLDFHSKFARGRESSDSGV